ncbi:hypothetical protein GLOIN_2v1485864 [Rhizophagus clarus]|uniref:Uncharacterized protein n=1 Tax=Rhizophagus clarus TaxID=94130 RepID=A0A8H3LLH2_9GLOM|nr:hypothetical protein GLOIN_2v1485864 [Rhizophagus clarus]
MFHGPIFNIKHFCIVLYSIREDTVFRYYDDMDTLSVYFAKASSGVIRYSEANDYILVSYYGDDKIISVEIYKALLCCHLFETSETIDNKPPLSFYPICYEVLLVSSKPSLVTFKETEDKVSEWQIDEVLPKDERKKLAEEARLMALEVEKYSYRLIEGGEKKLVEEARMMSLEDKSSAYSGRTGEKDESSGQERSIMKKKGFNHASKFMVVNTKVAVLN